MFKSNIFGIRKCMSMEYIEYYRMGGKLQYYKYSKNIFFPCYNYHTIIIRWYIFLIFSSFYSSGNSPNRTRNQ